MFWRHIETSLSSNPHLKVSNLHNLLYKIHPVSVGAPLCSESPRFEESAWYHQIGNFWHQKKHGNSGSGLIHLGWVRCPALIWQLGPNPPWPGSDFDGIWMKFAMEERVKSKPSIKDTDEMLSRRKRPVEEFKRGVDSKGFGQPLPNAKASRVAMRR